ncbi:MAG: response regulator transcription factor [Methylovulum sp.]|nr:MAG: response regulator transcription factor [Methylovulum sp.]
MTADNTVKKLLIVDDSKVSRMLMRAQIVAVRPEWIIVDASSGDEALILVEQDPPDYCMMDINMPGILGTDAAEKILEKHPSIRMVIFSANIQETYQFRANALGAAFVAKPVSEKSIALALHHFQCPN